MAEFFDWNPDRGLWYEVEDDHMTGDLIIHTRQDVDPVLERNKKLRNSGVNDLGGMRDKHDLKHYACIPAHIELELKQKGIDIYSRESTRRLIYEIEHNYPQCKVTNRKILGSKSFD
jgi:hypothetical protein